MKPLCSPYATLITTTCTGMALKFYFFTLGLGSHEPIFFGGSQSCPRKNGFVKTRVANKNNIIYIKLQYELALITMHVSTVRITEY